MENSTKKLVLQIEGPVIQLEGIIKGIQFIASALPDYPHQIDATGLSALLMNISFSADDAIDAIKESCGIIDSGDNKVTKK